MLEIKINLDTPEQKLELLNDLYKKSKNIYELKDNIECTDRDFINDTAIFTYTHKDEDVNIKLYNIDSLIDDLRDCKNPISLKNKIKDRDVFILHILGLCDKNYYNVWKGVKDNKFGFIYDDERDIIYTIHRYSICGLDICWNEEMLFLFPIESFDNLDKEFELFKNEII